MDTNKAEKLAAAKKKLKQFQQKGGSVSKNHNNDVSQSNQQIEQSFASSPHIENHGKVFHAEEAQNGEKQKEFETQQSVESLLRENNELLASNLSYQQLISNLEMKLNEEKLLYQKEREAFNISQQRSSKEEELQNTIAILIEEKNNMARKEANNEEKIRILEEEYTKQNKELEETKTSLNLFKTYNLQEISLLESKLVTTTNERDEANQELAALKKQYLENAEELKELHVQKASQADELIVKENAIKELKLELELLDVNLQQLKNAGPPTVDQSLEKMQKENSKILKEVDDLKEQLKKLGTEKEVLAQQYQQYILRLNGQIRTITSQAEIAASEKRNVETALEVLKEQITQLETEIANLRSDKTAREEPQTPDKDHEGAPPSTEILPEKNVQSSNEEIAILQRKLNEMNLNNEELAKLALEKESRIQELEIRIDRIQSELKIASGTNDLNEKEKLLQAIQSDKSAASRAIAQNRQLKIQLEELEKAFIQLSNDKLTLTEESQAVIRQNKEFTERFRVMEPELLRLRQEVQELTDQRSATVYWKQELEEAHERLQALTHQNAELKKRVVWNVNQVSSRTSRKHRHNKTDLDMDNNHTSSSSESEENDWVPSEEHQKLLFHFGQLEQKLHRSMTTISELTDEKQKLEHLVLQLQSETETIGEYVSLYQVQRGLLRRRAEQLADERLKLKERINKLSLLLPHVAPQLKTLPQWKQLHEGSELNENDEAKLADDMLDQIVNDEAGFGDIATKIVDVLTEISSSSLTSSDQPATPNSFHLDDSNHGPHENFHPCLVCSGRLMTV